MLISKIMKDCVFFYLCSYNGQIYFVRYMKLETGRTPTEKEENMKCFWIQLHALYFIMKCECLVLKSLWIKFHIGIHFYSFPSHPPHIEELNTVNEFCIFSILFEALKYIRNLDFLWCQVETYVGHRCT